MKDSNNCAHCNEMLDVSGDFITCGNDKCKLKYHNEKECSGMQPSTWNAKSKKSKKQWNCVVCRGSSDVIVDLEDADDRDKKLITVVNSLLAQYFDRNNSQLEDLKTSVLFQSQKYDELDNKLTTTLSSIEDIKVTSSNLKSEQDKLAEENKKL